MFTKVLIANRGEIAVRIARTCQRLGIHTVAVYSDADEGALHVRSADEAYYIGPSEARLSYLNADAILEAARASGAVAIHPGYGFLSENADFAERVIAAGLTWIGPPPAAIRAMGDKAAAKRLVAAAGVPVVPGYDGEEQDGDKLQAEAARIGYPLLIKATAGGGGRGMREVHAPEEFAEALASARREAQGAFGDGRVLLERLITGARHVEVQVFGDAHGNVLHLGERDCSIQRRHQKVIEEAPSPAVDEELLARMGEAAVQAALRAGYTNAGTVEFLLAPDRSFYFLEMNTRLQVEHPVTEMVTRLDLVELQLEVAAGEPLPFKQDGVTISGHAIEVRLYAEDPYNGFLPSTGTLTGFLRQIPIAHPVPQTSDSFRVDAGYEKGDTVGPNYDAMLAKIISFGASRNLALEKLAESLWNGDIVRGVPTNLPLLRAVLESEEFREGRVDTTFLERFWRNGEGFPPVPGDLAAAAGLEFMSETLLPERCSPWSTLSGWRATGPTRTLHVAAAGRALGVQVEVDPLAVSAPGADQWVARAGGTQIDGKVVTRGRERRLRIDGDERLINLHRRPGAGPSVHVGLHGRSETFSLAAPQTPDAASAGARIGGSGRLAAPLAGTVVKVNVSEGERVQAHQTLAVLEAMKMEHAIQAGADGRVKRVHCRPGQQVAGGELLLEIEAGEG